MENHIDINEYKLENDAFIKIVYTLLEITEQSIDNVNQGKE